MRFIKNIENALEKQKQKTKIKDCPLKITLKSGHTLNYCYIENETKKILTIAETTKKGTEELRIINKEDISYISIIYANTEIENTETEKTNNMYI